ncbi:MAG: glycosyltransferase family 9 protein [Flavobacteriaceae bacterium]
MKILVIQQKMIGDVLVSTLLCNNLRKAYPNAQIDYMVYKSTLPVLQGNTSVDNYILFERKHRRSKLEFFKLIFYVRKQKYDLVIDAYSKLESWLTVLFSNAPMKISYKKIGRTFLYTHNIAMSDEPKSNVGLVIERRLSLLDPLNLDIEIEVVPKLTVTDKEKEFVSNLFEEHHLDKSKKTVMISIIGSSPNKTYPLEYMSKVVNYVSEKTDANILFNYIPKQLDLAQEVFDNCSETTKKNIYFNLLGKNLREFIIIMDACDLIVGNDGGAINMAKALNKPSFIIFSPWIEKEMWSTFEDGKLHDSVHLKDYQPELFLEKSTKQLKDSSIELYPNLKPSFFKNKLDSFLDFNFAVNKVTSLVTNFNKIYSEHKTFPLSAVIITYNEEEHLEKCLSSLVGVADEVIVIDSYSTDGTEAICRKYNITFIPHKFEGYIEQKNYAIQQATNDYILSLDGDEALSEELKESILKVKPHWDHDGYNSKRLNNYCGQWIKHSDWYPDKKLRLFKKGSGEWRGINPHDSYTLKSGKKLGKLQGDLLHWIYRDYDEHKQKVENFSNIASKAYYKLGIRSTFFKIIFRPSWAFFKSYFLRCGFLDGKKGFLICKEQFNVTYYKYIKLYRLWHPKRN